MLLLLVLFIMRSFGRVELFLIESLEFGGVMIGWCDVSYGGNVDFL